MPIKTPLCDLLSIQHPIVLAPMDLISGAKLASAVSRAGGLGLLGAGYGDESWIRRETGAITALLGGSGAPFGFGFITWSLQKQPALLGVALKARPHAIMLSFGDPRLFARQIKDAGSKLLCQVQSEAMAEQALEAGADVLIAQGTEAGGHGASRSIFEIVPTIVDLVGGRASVVAAGGVADGRGLAACLALGADGVLLGTRFYASEEAEGHDNAKRRICEASSTDTIRSLIFDIARRNVWPAPFTGRCLRNGFTRRWEGRETELLQNAEPASIEYAAARARGDFDTAAVIAGTAVGLISDIPPAGEIVQRLVAEAESILRDRRNTLTSA